MKPASSNIQHRRRAGLGVVELLIALAITAALLTSVAIAFHASLQTVKENQDISSATNSARIILHRMMAHVRQADAVQTDTARITIIPVVESSDKDEIEFELLDGTLWYRETEDGTTSSYPMLSPADGLTINSFRVDSEIDTDPNGVDFTSKVTATLAITVNDNPFAITTSTNPRRNVEW